MNIKQLNELSIADFLETEGIQPKRKSGRNWWYLSPIRALEKTPSFKVDVKINRWYDHGIGEGGKLFDLALRLYQTSNVKAVIEALNNHYSIPRNPHPDRSFSAVKEPLIIIEEVKPLGFHQALVQYLSSRGIVFNIADQYCKDVSFKLKDKTYFAVGFQNRAGGFELRNSFFKGSSAPKDLTLVNNKSDSICVLEGFIDFLSLLTLKMTPSVTDFLILNSLSFVKKGLPILKEYRDVRLFLNNDESGKKATNAIIGAEISAKDFSSLYQGYNDLNEYLLGKGISVTEDKDGIQRKGPRIKF